MRRAVVWCFLASVLFVDPAFVRAAPLVLDVTDFGAVPDSLTLNTRAIQLAVDSCSAMGGGTVFFPSGTYLTGTIVLKSGVTLHLEAGATILGSANLEDYPIHIPAYRSYTDHYTVRSLIYAEGAQDVTIVGFGRIDGQGAAFSGPHKKRPYLLRFVQCHGVTLRDVTLQNSAMWVQHYLACEDVLINGIRVHSLANENNDGIDIDSCSRVRISDCEIRSGDDAIVLKATSGRPCRDVVVSNCVLSSRSNALKLGTESNGGFQNIAISNCAVVNTALGGLCLEEVDGGTLEGVTVHGLVMDGVGCPIFIRLGNRARPYTEGVPVEGVGKLRHVVISGVLARNVTDSVGCSITGIPGHPVRDVTLRDIRIEFPGRRNRELPNSAVPEREAAYPEYRMFGLLPAYGFTLHHVQEVILENVQLWHRNQETRPALVADDVDGLSLRSWRAQPPDGPASLLWLRDVRDVWIQGFRALKPGIVFLHLEGDETKRVTLFGNDFSGARQIVERGKEVSPEAVILLSNVND